MLFHHPIQFNTFTILFIMIQYIVCILMLSYIFMDAIEAVGTNTDVGESQTEEFTRHYFIYQNLYL